jgi:hypothetical protein
MSVQMVSAWVLYAACLLGTFFMGRGFGRTGMQHSGVASGVPAAVESYCGRTCCVWHYSSLNCKYDSVCLSGLHVSLPGGQHFQVQAKSCGWTTCGCIMIDGSIRRGLRVGWIEAADVCWINCQPARPVRAVV